MGFLTNEKTQNKTTRNEKTRQERKERVRGTYLPATSGGRCWVCSYAIGAISRGYVGNAESTGAAGGADGSAGSTRATKVGGGANLDDAATGLVVDATVASPSVPRMR